MKNVFVFITVVAAIFSAILPQQTLAVEMLVWEPSGAGREKAVAVSDDFVAVFLRNDPVLFGVILVITPRGDSPPMSVSSRREIRRICAGYVLTGKLFSGVAGGETRQPVSFQISDWGGFIIVQLSNKNKREGWLENSRIFRLYADGSVGVMDGREFREFVFSNGGFDIFRRSATEPQFPAPAAKPAATGCSWGFAKSASSAASLMEFFGE